MPSSHKNDVQSIGARECQNFATCLIFVDPGVKVDEIYYCVFLLSLQLLPGVRHTSGLWRVHISARKCPGIYGTLVFRTLIFHKVV